MIFLAETTHTKYPVRDNIYLLVIETDFLPMVGSYSYYSACNMYPGSEVEYIFVLDESAEFVDSADLEDQRREARELNNSDQSELIELVLEGVSVE